MLGKNGRTTRQECIEDRPKGVQLREVLLKESRQADKLNLKRLSPAYIPAQGCGVMSSKR
jgi:hypothetical protein